MFPIREPDGPIAGFIGRSMSTDPTAPKYLNTAASPTFTKSRLFYGLHEAAQAGGRHPVLVEGPLDALALAATADGHDLLPIATSGTALTTQHATQLAAWCRHHNVEPVIAYDPDPAGCAAALRAGELLRDHGLNPPHRRPTGRARPRRPPESQRGPHPLPRPPGRHRYPACRCRHRADHHRTPRTVESGLAGDESAHRP